VWRRPCATVVPKEEESRPEAVGAGRSELRARSTMAAMLLATGSGVEGQLENGRVGCGVRAEGHIGDRG
jgi:hypothetical protein